MRRLTLLRSTLLAALLCLGVYAPQVQAQSLERNPASAGVASPQTAPALASTYARGGTEVVQDGSFETGSPNSFWDEFEALFGTPLCSEATCGLGGGSGPFDGVWWAWFGGITSATSGYVQQELTIPSSDEATLSFYVEIPAADQAGVMNVLIDGDVLFTVTEADATTYATYQLVELDVSAYADGGTHTLRFESETQTGAGVTNFFIDAVSLLVGGEDPPPPPGDALLSEDFEGGIPGDWAVFGNEHSGDESVWAAYNEDTMGNVARSRYTFSVPDGEVAEDYLATPQLEITAPVILSFRAGQQFSTNYGSAYEVLVSTTTQTDISAYTTVASYTEDDFPLASAGGGTFEIDLSDYVGESIYIAFLHRGNNGDTWFLDDVEVAGAAAAPVAVLSDTEVAMTVVRDETSEATLTLANETEAGGLDLTFTASVAAQRPRTSRLVEAGASAPAPSAGEAGFARADGATDARAYTAIEGAPFAHLRGGDVMITHSASQTILTPHGISCGVTGSHTVENSYWRVFDLSQFPEVAGGYAVTSVDIGVESVTGPGLASKVVLYTLDGAFTTSNLTQVGEADFTLASGLNLEVINVPVTGEFSDSDVLVVEWRTGSGEATLTRYYPGANASGETSPTYISAPGCGMDEPVTMASIGFGDVHWVLNVHGTTEGGTGEPVLLSVSPRSGSVAAGESQEITLTADATDFEPGQYDFVVSFATNDPENPTLDVAVTVTVNPIVATEDGALPTVFALDQNYPNPFARQTQIAYALPEASHVKLSVYDAVGRLVTTLLDGERPAGHHEVVWEAGGLASGVYFYRIEAGAFQSTQKMILVK